MQGSTSRSEVPSLHAAAKNGDIVLVQQLIAAGADINAKLVDGRTVLHVAAAAGQHEAVQMLLREGADISATTTGSNGHAGLTPLHAAAVGGQGQVVQQLLAVGAALEATAFGMTPLFIAALLGHQEVLKVLLAAGAKLGARDDAGISYVLQIAALMSPHEAAGRLLAASVGMEKLNPIGSTTLHAAAAAGHVGIVQQLLAAGADIEATDATGDTPLHRAATAGCHEVVQVLLSAGANMEATDQRSATPLHTAALAGQYQVLQVLLQAGANLKAVGTGGTTPLHLAIAAGQQQPLQKLLDAGANIQAATADGFTALGLAAAQGEPEIMRLLLAARANTATAADLMIHLQMAVQGRCYDVVQLLLGAGAGPEALGVPPGGVPTLMLAAARSDVNIVQLLLDPWPGQPAVNAAALVQAAKAAAFKEKPAAFARLAKELQARYPTELHQLLQGNSAAPAAFATAAVLNARAADVNSIDEQRAAVREREEGVRCGEAAVQRLIVELAVVCAQQDDDQGNAGPFLHNALAVHSTWLLAFAGFAGFAFCKCLATWLPALLP